MSANGPILLLSGTAPLPDGVGGIILADLCSFLPPGGVCVAYVPEGGGREAETVLSGDAPMRTIPVPYQRRPESRFGKIGKGLQWLLQSLRNRRALARAADACVELGRSQRVGRVWAVMDSPVSVALAGRVARELGVPLFVTVWDDIEHNVRYFGIDRLTAKGLIASFEANLRTCAGCAVIGETMQAEYRTKYGVGSVILRHGLGAGGPDGEHLSNVGPRNIRIGFAGSMSARSAFDALLATLDRIGWHLAGRPVTLRLIGQRFLLDSKVARHIEYFGWQPTVGDAVRLLSECDVNYLPQPFETDWMPFARLSFPTKLTTYLAAGAPLLVHSPEGASLPAFVAKHPFGRWCRSLDTKELEKELLELIDWRSQERYARAGREALEAEFSREVFRSRFAAFLGIEKEGLGS